MAVKSKYQAVLDLGETLNIKEGDVTEENGVLKVKGTAQTQYEKNMLWDKIKEIGGQNPTDIVANIKVADTSVFHRHTVKSGETLGKIARHFIEDDYTGFEINADYRLTRDLYVTGEIGTEEKTISNDYLNSTAKGNYIKGFNSKRNNYFFCF